MITDLEELKNIVILGLDCYFVGEDSEIIHLHGMELKPSDEGLRIISKGTSAKYLSLCGIKDKTATKIIPDQKHYSGFLFDDFEEARSFSIKVFKDRLARRISYIS